MGWWYSGCGILCGVVYDHNGKYGEVLTYCDCVGVVGRGTATCLVYIYNLTIK